MIGRSLPVVPVADSFTPAQPADDEAAPSSPKDARNERRGRSSQRHYTSFSVRSNRRWVTITFSEEDEADHAHLYSMSSIEAREADRDNVEDLFVKRVWCCYSTFARHSNPLGWDAGMESKFGQLRYKNFRTAFMHASLFMMLGTLALAANSLSYGHYKRAVLLSVGVAPFYMGYGLFALRRKHKYLGMIGTRSEKGFIAILCLQMFVIVCAEWLRPDFDYGLLVMHIGFVHNFTPLNAGAMQFVTAACGLLPFVVLQMIRQNIVVFGSFLEVLAVQTPHPSLVDGVSPGCMARTGPEANIVRIIVPVVIFMYQVIVTMRRDESLRLDLLCRLNLVVQQQLLDAEKTRNEGLLMSMLPRKIIEALQNNDPVEPQHFEDVTVVFIEICHFDQLCSRLMPSEVVEVLNIVYLEFDRLSDMLQVYKVETVGQVYMAVVGCPEPVVNHADVAAHFAVAAQRSMLHIKGRIASKVGGVDRDNTGAMARDNTFECPRDAATSAMNPSGIFDSEAESPPVLRKSGSDLNVVIHVGLNSGPIRAGIVGIDSPRYKLFGDTVNTASRMESTCEPGRIQVSLTTMQRLTRGMFQLEDRGEIPVKGKGTMRTAYLNGYAKTGDEDNRRVLIEHGMSNRLQSSDDLTSPPSPTEAGGMKHLSVRMPGNTGILEDEILRLCSGSSSNRDTNTGQQKFCESNASSTSALVSAALGQMMPEETLQVEYYQSEGSKHSVAKMLTCLERMQLPFLLVPAEQKHPARLAGLRRDMPNYIEATREHRILIARNLTITWLLLMAILGGMDYFMDVLEEDLPTYRTAIIVRTLGNTSSGLVYLLLLLVPAVSKVAQQVTIAMLALQGIALLVCGTVLYNSEPAIIALYSAYILFFTVCTVTQRLMLCLASVTGYAVVEYARCGLEGVRNAADNFAFLAVFIIAMACSVRLQEYLQHVSHWEQHCTEKRLEDITLAQAAGSQLLTTLLPPCVVNRVGENLTSPIAEHHADVTILFTDIKGFTAYSSRITAQKLVTVLNSMYSAFDEVISNWALHKVEIIGDAYFVSAGCPPPVEGSEEVDPSEYAMRAVEVGLALLRTLPSVCDDTTVQMRAGLHTGSVVAGVVGKKGPRYHLFGSTVAYAEKMESHGIPGKVQLSEATHALLQQGNHSYDFEERNIPVEGEEGLQKTWVVNRSNSKVAFQIQKKLMTQRRCNQQKPSTTSRTATPAAREHARYVPPRAGPKCSTRTTTASTSPSTFSEGKGGRPTSSSSATSSHAEAADVRNPRSQAAASKGSNKPPTPASLS